MASVIVHCDSIQIGLNSGPDIKDITLNLNEVILESKIKNGSLCACMVGSTGSLTSIEFEPGVVEDLKQAVTRMASPTDVYEHEKAWHDGNGHSHVQAALMGPSITLPVRKGSLKLGTWQQVVAVNHDTKARNRNIEVTIIGS